MNEPGLEKGNGNLSQNFNQDFDARQKCVQNSDSLLESSKIDYDSYSNEKILPIELPIVQTFLSHAYLLAILPNKISYKGWFLPTICSCIHTTIERFLSVIIRLISSLARGNTPKFHFLNIIN
ncbi:hypothetical protein [Paenibacillus aquistagni]|uniref:hypothetical protein n=1 Tax=Paenibacillus aquistagni TaxID=1852522 RepID=UPI000B50D98A|nr:hypothetical protein [Paenibacillus aquistagni]NMM55493.1 hypothetical protein [Paenibacillus aquistagni]